MSGYEPLTRRSVSAASVRFWEYRKAPNYSAVQCVRLAQRLSKAIRPENARERARPPIGCNVKRESEAVLDEFSACLIAGGETAPRQRPLAPLRFTSRRRLSTRPSPSPCFSLGSGTLGPPHLVKAARGPSSIGARSASFLWPIARLP